MAKNVTREKMSPLYTEAGEAANKKKVISRLGKDSDGAYRIRGRLDKQS